MWVVIYLPTLYVGHTRLFCFVLFCFSLSTHHDHPWLTSMCVHSFLSGLLIGVFLLFSIIQVMSLTTIKKVLSSYYSHLSLAYDVYLPSSPSPLLAAIIWRLLLSSS
ncbi:hypothetical protein EDB87DRAFT_820964 [Lactarius vividus]|nr:hypothetical protein EDB87DRAFT_820964 [Lactarius vividus]